MEWDKEAAIPEVQRVTTSVDLNANDIQAITTSTEAVNEIQIITTSATPRSEIQSITVSPPPGHHALDPAWSFSMSLDTTFSGGSLQYSGQISATTSAIGSRDAVSSILGAMTNVEGAPSVLKSTQKPDGGHTYTVILLQRLRTEMSWGGGGSFRLQFQGETTGNIPYDVDASGVKEQLEMLSNVDQVSVFRGIADEQNGYSWEVEFTSDQNGGDLSNIIPHG